MKRVLILAFTDHCRDPRVYRQLHYFKSRGYHITTVGKKASTLTDEHHTVATENPFLLKQLRRSALILRCYSLYSSLHPSVRSTHLSGEWDLVVANDLETLPLALRFSSPVLFDAHEYSPKEWEERLLFRLLVQPYRFHTCRQLLPKVSFMTTVCEPIAKEYEKEFGVKAHLITNATHYHALEPKKVDPKQIKMIYHGVAAPARSLEYTLEIFSLLDKRFTLDLILIPGDSHYIEKIKKKAGKDKRIRFLDPVPMEKIPELCNQYDIGFFPLLPLNMNYRFGLGNKFFEFIQARIAIAISPLQEMQKITQEQGLGFVGKDFSTHALAELLNKASSEEIFEKKQACDRVAKKFSAEANFAILDELLASTCSLSSPALSSTKQGA